METALPLDSTLGQQAKSAIVMGKSRSTHILIFNPVASADIPGTLQKAQREALSKSGGRMLKDVQAYRECVYFPAPKFYFLAQCRTTVLGRVVDEEKLIVLKDLEPLKDAVASYPPINAGEELYSKMLAMSPLEIKEFSMLMPPKERDKVIGHILKTKGQEAYWSWKFIVHWDVSNKEREFIQWFLREYSPYRPIP